MPRNLVEKLDLFKRMYREYTFRKGLPLSGFVVLAQHVMAL